MNIGQYCYDLGIRVENLIHLQAQTAGGSMPQAVEEEWFDELEIDEFAEATEVTIPDWLRDEWPDLHLAKAEFLEWLHDHDLDRFWVQIACPVRTYKSEKSWGESWGYYRTSWFHAQTLEQALEKAGPWVREQNEKDRVRSLSEHTAQKKEQN